MVIIEHPHHSLTPMERENLFTELDDASARMERIQQLMTAVYGEDSQEMSRAEQAVHSIFRLKRELVRGGAQGTMSAAA
jgi:hypothetical protein